MIALQDSPIATNVDNYVAILQSLGWVDKTALAVLLVFFVLGLFKGLIWQVSRIGILLAAYCVAGRYGHDIAGMLDATPAAPVLIGEESSSTIASTSPNLPPTETTLYLSYCLLFVGVLIVLSLLAMLLKELADRAGLGFFDRLGGGVLGVATGACVVLACVFGINMFFPSSNLALAAGGSHSLAWSQKAISWLGDKVDNDLRSVLSLQPLEQNDATPNPGPAANGMNNIHSPRRSMPRGDPSEGSGGTPKPSPGPAERGATGGDRNGVR